MSEAASQADADALLRRFALALCVYREARGEPALGKIYVAQTVKNRVLDPRWPDTYIGVITQPLQFSAFNKTDANVTVFPSEGDAAWKDSVAVADAVLTAVTQFTTANHYHVKGLTPPWRDDSKIVAAAGAHVFYCL
jgi:spore germination cell wall hydrolase CwlJ-like protein